MEVYTDRDDELLLHKRSPLATRCRSGHRAQTTQEDHEGAGDHAHVRRRCAREQSLRISVASNPRPTEPVATRYTLACSRHPSGHEWRVTVANATSRRYFCLCGYEIREKKGSSYWETVSATVSEPAPRSRRVSDEAPEDLPSRLRPVTRSQTRVTRSSTSTSTSDLESTHMGQPIEEHADNTEESDAEDSMSIYESAVEDESPTATASVLGDLHSPRRSSGGTTNSDAPSSLDDLPHLRRLPHRMSTKTHRSPPAPGATEVPPAERRLLVSMNPKPTHPVATSVSHCQAAAAHHWKVWGNATCRRYTCAECAYVVKEQKSGAPEVWISVK
ncbi:hypothetical protein BV20DRAFT_948192 [Pilatotrama ljubarskyi]|nr:hypothetical protein BV20DRAFT_948192 [Pilatotrama ljubarskyi]